jgi:hypothetical protein
MEFKRVRKKPVEVEAFQLTKEIFDKFILEDGGQKFAFSETLEGTHTASVGDWIIRGIKGEHYPCKPDIFEQTYDIIDD